MQKRSLSIAGHRTSIALEPEFWRALELMAAAEAVPLPALIRRIDDGRATPNLSSALRTAVLLDFARRVGIILDDRSERPPQNV